MKKIILFIAILILNLNVVAQNNISSPYWKLEKTFNYPDKSKNELFNLGEKFVDYGWQPSIKSTQTTIEKLETGKSQQYELNKVIQFENKEKGIIKCHVLSAFQSRFHSDFVTSIWFEYNVRLTINNKGNIIIEISELKADEFVSNEQKMSGLYRNQIRGLERDLLRIPDELNEYILKN